MANITPHPWKAINWSSSIKTVHAFTHPHEYYRGEMRMQNSLKPFMEVRFCCWLTAMDGAKELAEKTCETSSVNLIQFMCFVLVWIGKNLCDRNLKRSRREMNINFISSHFYARSGGKRLWKLINPSNWSTLNFMEIKIVWGWTWSVWDGLGFFD